MGSEQSDLESRFPKLYLPGKVISRELTVEDGQLAVVFAYDDGLVVTLIVDEDQVRFKANRDFTVDEDGVVIFEGTVRPS